MLKFLIKGGFMLGEQIRKLRREKKLTQGQLGDILNVSHGTIGMWETNNRAPDVAMLQKLASFFEVSMEYLISGDESKKFIPQQNSSITIYGRGGGAKTYLITEKQRKVIEALLEDEN